MYLSIHIVGSYLAFFLFYGDYAGLSCRPVQLAAPISEHINFSAFKKAPVGDEKACSTIKASVPPIVLNYYCTNLLDIFFCI